VLDRMRARLDKRVEELRLRQKPPAQKA